MFDDCRFYRVAPYRRYLKRIDLYSDVLVVVSVVYSREYRLRLFSTKYLHVTRLNYVACCFYQQNVCLSAKLSEGFNALHSFNPHNKPHADWITLCIANINIQTNYVQCFTIFIPSTTWCFEHTCNTFVFFYFFALAICRVLPLRAFLMHRRYIAIN